MWSSWIDVYFKLILPYIFVYKITFFATILLTHSLTRSFLLDFQNYQISEKLTNNDWASLTIIKNCYLTFLVLLVLSTLKCAQFCTISLAKTCILPQTSLTDCKRTGTKIILKNESFMKVARCNSCHKQRYATKQTVLKNLYFYQLIPLLSLNSTCHSSLRAE